MTKPMRPFSFGPYSRYRATEFETRFGATEFHVHDAETVDPVTGGPALVRQFDARAELDAFVLAVDDDRASRELQARAEAERDRAEARELPSARFDPDASRR